MDEFTKDGLEFFLPNVFMGLSKNYILKCITDIDIQDNWSPEVGDVIVGSTGNCFIIASKQELTDSLGGPIYFFGASLCSRDHGHLLNDTTSYTMNKNGVKPRGGDKHTPSSFKDFRFAPRLDQYLKIKKNDFIEMIEGRILTEKNKFESSSVSWTKTSAHKIYSNIINL